MSRGPAIWATAIALALFNIGLAAGIAQLISARGFAPLWVSVLILALGAVAAIWAFTLWRDYLSGLKRR